MPSLPPPPSRDPGTITLLRQAEEGDSLARDALFNRFCRPGGYYHQMLQWVASLGLREKAEDIVQAAVLAFYRRVKAGRTAGIRDRDHLRALLYQITRGRVSNDFRDSAAEKRDASRTRPSPVGLESEAIRADTQAEAPDWEVAVRDLIENLLACVPERLRMAGELFLEGASARQMAETLGVALSTAERYRTRLRTLWSQRLIDLGVISPDGEAVS